MSSTIRITAHQAPLVDAAMEIKYHIAESHLWLEHAVTDGNPADLDRFRDHLDQAKWYARAMMEGGEDYHGEFIPLSDPRLRSEIEQVLQILEQVDSSALERWSFREESGIGTEADQRFDMISRTLIDAANRVGLALQQAIGKELRHFQKLQGALMVLAIALGVLVAVLLHVYERQKRTHLRTLQKSEEKLSITLDSIGDGVIAADTEGRVTRLNPVAEKLTGWTFDKAVGHPMDEVFHIVNVESRQTVENPGLRALREGTIVGLANHMVLINRNGTETQIADSASPIYNLDGEIIGVVLVFRDVTALYAKEEAIRKSEKKYRTFFENSTDAMLILEGDRFIDCNAATARMLGYDQKAELLNTHPSKLSPETQPDGQSSFEKAEKIMALAREQGSYCFEWMHLRKDGTEIPIEVSLTAIESEKGAQLHTVWRDLTERKQAEKMAQTIFESAGDGLLVADVETQCFVAANAAICHMLGYSAEELKKLKIGDIHPPQDLDYVQAQVEKQLRQEILLAPDIHMLRKDGSTFFTDVSSTPLELHGRMHLLGVFRDVTERKAAADKIIQQQYFLEKAQELGQIGTWEFDPKQNQLHWTDEACRIFGVPPGTAVNYELFLEIVHPDDREMVDKRWTDALAGLPYDIEHRLLIDGEIKWVRQKADVELDESGAAMYAVGFTQDITGRKLAEEERERLTLAIEQAADIVLITDAEANIQYVNSAFEKVTGYSREEVIGQNPRILQSGEHSGRFYKKMWDTLTDGQPWSGQLINKKKDGTVYTEEATISPVMDGAGKIVNYVAAKRDATHELALEEQLRQAQKMEAVGQMAGGIAHDFNNLLQVISGYVELSEMFLKPDNEFVPAVKEIGKAAERGRGLVCQLLAFSRRQVIQPTDLNLNDVIDPLLFMMRGLIGEHIELDFVACSELGTVHADRGLIEQTLMNLCVNARDAMPDGGRLVIKTENVLIEGDYARTHAWATPGCYAMLTVTDTGCGMDGPTLERVFEPFFTTKEVGKGTGLGLSTVFGIIKQHSGHINTYSEVGKGTNFKIYLPTVERKAAVVSREPREPVVGGTETILIAEDDETVLALAEHLLIAAGYTVLTAIDGKDAIRVFEEHADEIDAVMFDVVMPRLGGKQALDRILELRPGLPHLFASGYSEGAVHTNFVQKRGLHLLNKPYQVDTLLRKIREVLDEK
ncbi:MAG: PAS domain S-box protein [Kiritimatiellaeota bacterium]|nr:PAS domain S-box protein [Kiritimatiellota bacterium]